MKVKASPPQAAQLPIKPQAAQLLRWYDKHGRDLPWRVKNGGAIDPYAAWLAEIMLQQTTVTAVIPYYQKFLQQWPTIQSLACADLAAVRTAWAGLGYYRRAQNLHRCAQIIVAEHHGVFPKDVKALKQLPGIGDYTSAALAAIAYNQPANVVDGNVERIMARLHRVARPMKAAKTELRTLAARYTPKSRHGDYAQALMDLGATVCTPKQPNCPHCPWQRGCEAFAKGQTHKYPVLAPKTVKPHRRAIAFWLEGNTGAVWLRQRPETGLLGGMIEVPSSPWLEQGMPALSTVKGFAPKLSGWQPLPLQIRHSFTHFDLTLQIMYAKGETKAKDGFWAAHSDLKNLALPSLMHKICTAVKAWREE